jgi:membrane protease YdiL (CAAX protease family)
MFQPHHSNNRQSADRWTDPFLLIFAALYGLAFLGLLSVVPGEWLSALTLAVGVVAVSAIVLPGGLLLAVRGRGVSLRETLRSVGLSRRGLGAALQVAILTASLLLPVILLSVNPQQRADILAVLRTPLTAVVRFPVSFALALLLAGFTEEFFFRGILQSRLAAVTGSELRGLVITSLLFGLLHLPHAYFLPTWPTHGNMVWSLATVATEQAVAGLLLGVLWARTHNLATPALVHAFVNGFVLMTSFGN